MSLLKCTDIYYLQENSILDGIDRDDDLVYTALILDYYRVMIEGQEGGEYQEAPWFDSPREQKEHVESKGMVAAISPSRSLAEWDEYIYLMHHPEVFGGLPDLQILRILPLKPWEQASTINTTKVIEVSIFNRGMPWGNGHSNNTGHHNVFYKRG